MVLDLKQIGQDALAFEPLTLGWWRHYKFANYVVYSLSVDEAAGSVFVHYMSVTSHYRWTRTRDNFIERVGDRQRFEWWRPATVDELAAAAFGGPDILRRVFGSPI